MRSMTDPRRPRFPTRLLAVMGSAALLLGLLPLISVSTAEPANATYATTGEGLYRGDIDWMVWGGVGASITNNQVARTQQTVGGQNLVTSCTATNILSGLYPAFSSSSLRAYLPGTWGGDGLDDLYNVGGAGSANTLVSGMTNFYAGDTVTLTVTCSATLDGVAAKLSGLVFADAEASNLSSNEYISARSNTAGSTWRVIDRRLPTGCNTSTIANLSTNGTFRLSPNGEECAGGPMAVAYADGANSLNLTIKGGGKSALALGVVLAADFGDAPASYGSAGALFQPGWSGAAITNPGSYPVPLLTLPAQVAPPTRLGATIDADSGYQASPGATLDDTTMRTGGVNDEDAVGALGTISVSPGVSYTLPGVACTGPGSVAGWIDWNANGTFDTGERSALATCTGTTTVSLTWTVPADVRRTPIGGTGFLRLRIAADAAQLTSPIGMTTSGEVEDHAITVNVPTLSVQKNVSARVASADQFTLTLRNPTTTIATATTSGATRGVQASSIQASTGLPGTTYTFTEAMATGSTSALTDYVSNSQCTLTYPGGTTTVLAAQSGATGTVTVPALNASLGHPAINCVFTNDPQAATVAVEKTWVVNGTTYAQGSQPAGITAQASLTRDATVTTPAWGAVTSGYASGDRINVAETTAFAASIPGCTVTSQRLTTVNGTTTDAALPYTLTALTGANTVRITNTVTCATTLALTKRVVGGTAAANSWTLSALPATGAAQVTGVTGVSGNVTPGTTLQLAESAGNAEYVQDDTRTAAEITAAPRSTGSWVCTTLNAQGTAIAGTLPARTGTNGTVTAPIGSRLSCEATNRTAQITLLKFVENVNGTGTATPANWNLTATPVNPAQVLTTRTVAGSSTVATANTVTVRPGQAYALTEAGTVGGYHQVALQRFTGSDPGNAAAIASAANWVTVSATTPVSVAADSVGVYRFVNRDAVAFQLPFTGNTGASPYLIGGGLLGGLTVVAAIIISRRRKLQRP